LTGDKKVSKNGLNNISTETKKISRNEAARKYKSLSSESRDDADDWINNRFYLATGFPKNVKLDPNNPEHGDFIEEWLKQRDIVMGWNRDWETTQGQDRIHKYFSEKTDPTPKSKLERGEGIFEQRMSGSEFKQFVYSRLDEVKAYTNPTARRLVGRKTYEGKIAEDIITKLVGNEVWLKNTVEARDGREALRLSLYLLPNTRENRSNRQIVKTALKPYEREQFAESIVNRAQFYMVYSKLEAGIKANLESEDYTVENIYVREFTTDTIEIRASVSRQVTLDTDSYGYRSDPYVSNVRTERKNISVGGFRYSTGAFLNKKYFEKHGTINTDWDTQLAIGELAFLAGVGIRSVISGVGSVLVKAGKTGVKELGQDAIERSVKDTISDPAIGRITRKTLDDLPYTRTQRLDRTPTQSMTTGEPSLPRIKQPKTSKRESSDTLAPAIVPDKGAKWYKNTKRITASLEDGATPRQLQEARARAASRKPGARELKEAPPGRHDLHITRMYGDRVPPEQIPRYSERLTAKLGDTPQIQNRNQEIFRKTGFTEQDVSEWVGRLQKRAESMGLDHRNAEKAVQSHISTESGLIQHLKNKNGLTWKQVRGELQESAPSGGDVRLAIAQLDEGVKLEKSWTKAKNDYPGIEGTPRGVRLLKDLGRKAHHEAYKDLDDMLTLWDRGGLRSMEKRSGVSVLSATEAGAAISLTHELRETKKENESLPKIREKSKQKNEQNKIRENRIKPKTSKLRANF